MRTKEQLIFDLEVSKRVFNSNVDIAPYYSTRWDHCSFVMAEMFLDKKVYQLVIGIEPDDTNTWFCELAIDNSFQTRCNNESTVVQNYVIRAHANTPTEAICLAAVEYKRRESCETSRIEKS